MANAHTNGADSVTTNGRAQPPAGVVVPPPAIREKLEKTAGFVVRQGPRGPAFEHKLVLKAHEQTWASFVLSNDPYHPYYEWFKEEIIAGRGVGQENAAPKAPEKPKGPVAPPAFRFSAKMPQINAKDLEVLRLTALYTAKNGEAFKRTLTHKESNNFQFDFLRPTHSYYTYFVNLVDQYKILLDHENDKERRIEELRRNIEDRFHLLGRAKQRAEYTKYQEQQKQAEEKRIEDEKREYASIDWHDFIVVATLTFDQAEDQAELAPPTSLNNLQTASLEQKAQNSLQPLNRRIDEAAPDEETYYNVGQQQMPPPVPSPAPQALPQRPMYSPPPQAAFPMAPPPVHDEEEERRIRERNAERERAEQAMAAARGAGPMRIRENYVPRAAAKKQQSGMGVCPNCHQLIPYEELDDHVRSMIACSLVNITYLLTLCS